MNKIQDCISVPYDVLAACLLPSVERNNENLLEEPRTLEAGSDADKSGTGRLD
jgi:hypothetical protein